MSRPPEQYREEYDFGAKEVRSLGGNNGFEHVEVSVPSTLRREVEVMVARLYHRFVTYDPFFPRSWSSRSQVTFNEVDTNVRVKPD